MKIYEIVKGAASLEGLRAAQRPEPKPGPNDVLVRIRAAALTLSPAADAFRLQASGDFLGKIAISV
jgi:hypothetical protein